jgi:hypothetical protein
MPPSRRDRDALDNNWTEDFKEAQAYMRKAEQRERTGDRAGATDMREGAECMLNHCASYQRQGEAK